MHIYGLKDDFGHTSMNKHTIILDSHTHMLKQARTHTNIHKRTKKNNDAHMFTFCFIVRYISRVLNFRRMCIQ